MFNFLRKPDPGVTAAGGLPRSPKWAAWLKAFLRGKSCIACGACDGLTGHHVVPFHVDPSRELDATNVVAICIDRCHIVWGHCDDFALENPSVREDAADHLAKRLAAKARAKARGDSPA